MKINILITITLLITNLSAWSICNDDEMYKGERTYNLLMAGTGSNQNFLNGATCFQSPVLSHLEETISIIQNPKKGPAYILKSDAYKTMIKEAKNQCSVSIYSTPCKMYQVAIAIVETAIKQQDDSQSSSTSKKITNLELKILRNLPYAKRGYIFKSKKLMNFYKSKKWYKEDITYIAKLSDLNKPEIEWRTRVIEYENLDKKEFIALFSWYEELFYYYYEKESYEKNYAKRIFNFIKLKNTKIHYLTEIPKKGIIINLDDYELKEIATYFKKNKKAHNLLKFSRGVAIEYIEDTGVTSISFTFLPNGIKNGKVENIDYSDNPYKPNFSTQKCYYGLDGDKNLAFTLGYKLHENKIYIKVENKMTIQTILLFLEMQGHGKLQKVSKSGVTSINLINLNPKNVMDELIKQFNKAFDGLKIYNSEPAILTYLK